MVSLAARVWAVNGYQKSKEIGVCVGQLAAADFVGETGTYTKREHAHAHDRTRGTDRLTSPC